MVQLNSYKVTGRTLSISWPSRSPPQYPWLGVVRSWPQFEDIIIHRLNRTCCTWKLILPQEHTLSITLLDLVSSLLMSTAEIHRNFVVTYSTALVDTQQAEHGLNGSCRRKVLNCSFEFPSGVRSRAPIAYPQHHFKYFSAWSGDIQLTNKSLNSYTCRPSKFLFNKYP